MNSKTPRKKIPVKTIFHHVIRAKLYAVLTMNSLEGMMMEMNHLIPQDFEEGNFDIFDEHLRRFQEGILVPTSHGDYLDRAVKSLAKELDVPVNTELINAQAVKKVIMSIAKGASEQEKVEIQDWLNESNETIIKSPRYEQLIDHACMFFYKKSSTQVCEDTLNFIRRSANELLRNKASKEAMRKRLNVEEEDEAAIDKVIRDNDMIPKDYDMINVEIDDDKDGSSSDDEFILGKPIYIDMRRRDKPLYDSDGYIDKRQRDSSSMQMQMQM